MRNNIQILVVALLIACAYLIPETPGMLERGMPSGYYLLGGFVGAVAVSLAAWLALTVPQRYLRNLLIGCCMLTALVLMLLMLLGALTTNSALLKPLFYLCAALPLVGFSGVLIQANKASRPG